MEISDSILKRGGTVETHWKSFDTGILNVDSYFRREGNKVHIRHESAIPGIIVNYPAGIISSGNENILYTIENDHFFGLMRQKKDMYVTTIVSDVKGWSQSVILSEPIDNVIIQFSDGKVDYDSHGVFNSKNNTFTAVYDGEFKISLIYEQDKVPDYYHNGTESYSLFTWYNGKTINRKVKAGDTLYLKNNKIMSGIVTLIADYKNDLNRNNKTISVKPDIGHDEYKLTKREQFAAIILQGYISAGARSGVQDMIENAVWAADNLIIELNKESTNE